MLATMPQSSPKAVLLAHDSPTVVRLLGTLCTSLGAELSLASSHQEYLELVHQKQWNLAILGSSFDGVPFDSLCESFREHWSASAVPIIVVSADEKDSARAYEAGTDFFLTLPIDPVWTPKILERFLFDRRCIVAADDSATIRLQLSNVLKQEGYWVITSKDGEEAWTHIRRFVPDVVLLDVQMPKLDGYQLCERIREHPITRHTPVVFITSQDSPADLERSFNVGANEFLAKPVDDEDLRQMLKRIFRGMRLRGRDRILVIDDSPTVLGMLRYGLGQHGFQVISARNGEEGLRKALRFKPTVIISDWQMPQMTGTELCRHLRQEEETRDAAIILVSSRSTRADAIKALREGADEYIVKPFNFERLVATVERLVAERVLKRERELLRTYLSATVRQLAERLAPGSSDLNELRADERVLTVMFVDIVGFTKLCEHRSPRDVVNFLNRYWDELAALIEKHAGVIDKFIGDAVLALFGFNDTADGAKNAVECARELVAGSQRFVHGFDDAPLEIRVGINTGQLIYGDLGAAKVRREFTVIGDAVNVAQRLEALAPPSSVLISEATASLLDPMPAWSSSVMASLKGRTTPVRCYVLQAESET
ncbi:MAG: response regulator [Myxococcota bacterium]|jgi:DNA-binding response OmpR family regulator|nr:response regulator [Myxococcota bacterium]